MKKMEDGKVLMTFDEYDLLVLSAQECGHKLTDWYPKMDKIVELAQKDFYDNVKYFIWIMESNEEMSLTKDQWAVRRFLENELRNNLVLVDSF